MNKDATKKPIDVLFLGGLNLLGILFALFFFRIYFISNDDITLLSIMNGSYTGTPDAHLIYIMYPLGLIFKGLYSLSGKVPFYEIFTLIVQFGCVFLESFLVYYLYRKKVGEKGKYLFVLLSHLFFYFLHLQFIVESQYTLTAGILSAIAIFYLVLLSDVGNKKFGIFGTAVVIVCATFSLWLRKETFLMALPLYALAFLFSLIRDRKEEGYISKYSAVLIILGVIVSVSFFTQNLAYSSKEWKDYKAFNEARTDVFDYHLMPAYSDNADFYADLGMNADDYTALIEYNLNLVDNLNTDSLNAMATRQKDLNEQWKAYYNVFHKSVKDTFASVQKNLKSLQGIFVFVAFFAAFIRAFFYKEGKSRALLIALSILGILYYFAFTAYFTYLGRLPERVYISLDFQLICLFLGAMLSGMGKEQNRGGKAAWIEVKIFLGICAVVTGIIAVGTVNRNQTYYKRQSEALSFVAECIDSSKDDVLFVSSGVTATAAYPFFSVMNCSDVSCFNMVDWGYQSPLMKLKMQKAGIEDMKKTMTNENSTILLVDSISTDWMLNLLSEEGESLSASEVKEADGVVALKIVR